MQLFWKGKVLTEMVVIALQRVTGLANWVNVEKQTTLPLQRTWILLPPCPLKNCVRMHWNYIFSSNVNTGSVFFLIKCGLKIPPKWAKPGIPAPPILPALDNLGVNCGRLGPSSDPTALPPCLSQQKLNLSSPFSSLPSSLQTNLIRASPHNVKTAH